MHLFLLLGLTDSENLMIHLICTKANKIYKIWSTIVQLDFPTNRDRKTILKDNKRKNTLLVSFGFEDGILSFTFFF